MRKAIVFLSAVGLGLMSSPAAISIDSAPITVKPKEISLKSAKNGDKKSKNHKSSKLKPTALVSFDQSGGFAGVHKTFETALKDLQPQDAEKLSELIISSGLMKAKNVKKTNPNAADVFFYQFKLINGKNEYQATYDDTTLPETFRPLLEFLKTKAVDAGRT